MCYWLHAIINVYQHDWMKNMKMRVVLQGPIWMRYPFDSYIKITWMNETYHTDDIIYAVHQDNMEIYQWNDIFSVCQGNTDEQDV